MCWLVVTENCGTDLGLEVWRICPPMDLWIIKCLRWWWSYMKYAQSNGYKFALLNKSLSSSTDSWLFSFSAKKIMFNSWGLTLKKLSVISNTSVTKQDFLQIFIFWFGKMFKTVSYYNSNRKQTIVYLVLLYVMILEKMRCDVTRLFN